LFDASQYSGEAAWRDSLVWLPAVVTRGRGAEERFRSSRETSKIAYRPRAWRRWSIAARPC